LEHGNKRGQQRSTADLQQHDLGNEPPLSVDGETTGLVDRRRVSVQWFSGTVLTGLCGAALMGGAVFASLDGESTFAAVAERQDASLRGPVGGASERVARKSDRLPAASELTSRRQVIRVSTTARAGNREVVRVRPFVRVAGNLSLTLSDLSSSIPKFNPQKLLNDDSPQNSTPADTGMEGASDAEVSFVTRDLAGLLPRAKTSAAQSPEEVMGQLREAAKWSPPASAPNAGPAMAFNGAGMLAYAAEGSPDPYAGFEARVVPENITLRAKTAQTDGPFNEKIVLVKRTDTLASILKDLGATPEEIKGMVGALGARGKDGVIKEGYKLRVLLAPASGLGQRLAPQRVIVVGESGIEAIAALSDLGKYVSVDVDTSGVATAQAGDEEDEEDDGASGVRLYQSIYETALRQQIPRGVVDDMIRVYSFDVDFQRKVQPGDSFEVLYAGDDENALSEKSDVLFASLTVGGETKKFYRFLTPDDGVVDYYDETGKSAKKFLVRKPVANGIMRSGFGGRSHPILGYTKMHTGVDWAAPYGTPIFASGNGVIEKIGWEGGYGRYIRMRHNNGYETAYGHMTAFARGMAVGSKVRQGQVIGYVGSTGLSTGAHVHYEILVNGRFVDPLRIRLPRGRVLDGPTLVNFEQERDRVDSMMTRPGGPSTRTAQVGN